jgi:hypothetical protein
MQLDTSCVGGTQRASAGTKRYVAIERSGRKLELAPTLVSISFAAAVLTCAEIDAIIEETATATATKRASHVTERRKAALQRAHAVSCIMMRVSW